MQPHLTARNRERQANVAAASKVPPLESPQVFDPPNEHTAGNLAKLEKAADGPLPLWLRAWYEQVGRVSLMGSHPVLNPKDDRRDPLAPPPEMVSMIDAIGLDHVAVWGEMEALGAEIAGTCEDAQKVIRETMVPQTDERHLRHRELTIRSTGVPSKCQFP